jgi:hypothetical protein
VGQHELKDGDMGKEAQAGAKRLKVRAWVGAGENSGSINSGGGREDSPPPETAVLFTDDCLGEDRDGVCGVRISTFTPGVVREDGRLSEAREVVIEIHRDDVPQFVAAVVHASCGPEADGAIQTERLLENFKAMSGLMGIAKAKGIKGPSSDAISNALEEARRFVLGASRGGLPIGISPREDATQLLERIDDLLGPPNWEEEPPPVDQVRKAMARFLEALIVQAIRMDEEGMVDSPEEAIDTVLSYASRQPEAALFDLAAIRRELDSRMFG